MYLIYKYTITSRKHKISNKETVPNYLYNLIYNKYIIFFSGFACTPPNADIQLSVLYRYTEHIGLQCQYEK